MRQAVRALLTTAMTLGIFAGLGYGVQKVNLRGAATAAKEEVCLWIPMRRPPPRCLPDGFRRPPTARGPARLTPGAHEAALVSRSRCPHPGVVVIAWLPHMAPACMQAWWLLSKTLDRDRATRHCVHALHAWVCAVGNGRGCVLESWPNLVSMNPGAVPLPTAASCCVGEGPRCGSACGGGRGRRTGSDG